MLVLKDLPDKPNEHLLVRDPIEANTPLIAVALVGQLEHPESTLKQ